MAGSGCNFSIAGNKRNSEFLCQRNVGSVIGRKVVPQHPDSAQEGQMIIPVQAQAGEILQRVCPLGMSYESPSNEIAKSLGKFDIYHVGSM